MFLLFSFVGNKNVKVNALDQYVFENITENSSTLATYNSDIYFIKYNKPTVSVSSNTTITTSLAIQVGKDSMLEINNSTNGNLVINMSAGSSMEVDLYDDEMDLSNSYTGTSIAFETNGAYSKYYIRVNYVTSSSSGNVSISLIKHNHSYVYSQYDSTQHNCSCSCGISFKADHIWTVTSYGGGLIDYIVLQPQYIPLYVCTACGYQTTRPPMGI